MEWEQAVKDYLKTLRERTGERYGRALRSFEEWYRGTYGAAPDPSLLTDDEITSERVISHALFIHISSPNLFLSCTPFQHLAA